MGSLSVYLVFLWSLGCCGKCKADRHGVLKRTLGLLLDALQTQERLRLAKRVARDGGQKLMPVEGGVGTERAFYGISLGSNPSLLPAVAQGLPTEFVTFSGFSLQFTPPVSPHTQESRGISQTWVMHGVAVY